MVILKIILLSALALIFIQDFKDRKVYWFLFPIFGVCSSVLFYKNILSDMTYIYLGMNTLIISIMLLTVFLYTKIKLRLKLNEAFGTGDILFFIALIFTFATLSFLYTFVFALVFALVCHLVLNKKNSNSTVPLAGYMSLFFALTYGFHWMGFSESLYII